MPIVVATPIAPPIAILFPIPSKELIKASPKFCPVMRLAVVPPAICPAPAAIGETTAERKTGLLILFTIKVALNAVPSAKPELAANKIKNNLFIVFVYLYQDTFSSSKYQVIFEVLTRAKQIHYHRL
jgi:hypothetical protein